MPSQVSLFHRLLLLDLFRNIQKKLLVASRPQNPLKVTNSHHVSRSRNCLLKDYKKIYIITGREEESVKGAVREEQGEVCQTTSWLEWATHFTLVMVNGTQYTQQKTLFMLLKNLLSTSFPISIPHDPALDSSGSITRYRGGDIRTLTGLMTGNSMT